MSDRPLWTVEAMAGAMHAARSGDLPDSVLGISIDTRTIAPGEAFFAIKGENRDGHDFVGAALVAGAGVAVVAASRRDGLASIAWFPSDSTPTPMRVCLPVHCIRIAQISRREFSARS